MAHGEVTPTAAPAAATLEEIVTEAAVAEAFRQAALTFKRHDHSITRACVHELGQLLGPTAKKWAQDRADLQAALTRAREELDACRAAKGPA